MVLTRSYGASADPIWRVSIVAALPSALGVHARADVLEELAKRADVGDVGKVGQAHRFGRQERRGQAGQRRVLGPGDGDFALQAGGPFDQELVHGRLFL